MLKPPLKIKLIILPLLLMAFISAGMSSFRPVRAYQCLRVIDGDTVVLKGKRLFKVRLSYIDAPESSQRSMYNKKIGLWSKNYLEQLIQDKKIRFKYLGTDLYGRKLGEIFYKGESINLKMVRSGYALSYPYQTQYRYLASEQFARFNHLGLWKTYGFMAPWKYRKRH